MENNFDFIVLENSEQTTLADGAETTVADTEEVEEGVNVSFQGWDQFAHSFEYMGIGMLGIFIVTAILIMCISLLNKIKPKDQSEE